MPPARPPPRPRGPNPDATQTWKQGLASLVCQGREACAPGSGGLRPHRSRRPAGLGANLSHQRPRAGRAGVGNLGPLARGEDVIVPRAVGEEQSLSRARPKDLRGPTAFNPDLDTPQGGGNTNLNTAPPLTGIQSLRAQGAPWHRDHMPRVRGLADSHPSPRPGPGTHGDGALNPTLAEVVARRAVVPRKSDTPGFVRIVPPQVRVPAGMG